MKLSPRLEKTASLVPNGSYVIDVGTDHAHLPIALCQRGICISAVASDLRKGPCERAKENIALYGFSDKISVVQTNGLCRLESYPCSCIVIAGMGAEIMTQILKSSEMPKNSAVTLILQPQKYNERLRSYLATEGFEIDGEYLVRDVHLYQIIVCHYTAKPYKLSLSEMYLGKRDCRKSPDLFFELAKNQTDKIKRILKTKENADFERNLLKALENDINEVKNDEAQ